MSNVDIASMNLAQKLAKIREKVEILHKNKKGYGYTYVSEDEILAGITAGLRQYRVDVYPSIIPDTVKVEPIHLVKTKTTKGGDTFDQHTNEVVVSAEMQYTWVNLDNTRDNLIVPWVLVGQQEDASQAFGSGLTYCNRYFLLKFFKVSTSDEDPDNWRAKQKAAAEMEQAAVAKEIISQVDKIGREHITDANRADVTKLIRSVVRVNGKPSADFFSVTDVETATALLSKMQAFFGLDGDNKTQTQNNE